ncbi:hypothetical protein [Sphingomonas colocasiae]|uniref:SH3 domain-containing protein n=1 Tax=Sphingomonas colocasiae TaxID=1848973 RepID=A0ABS7PWK2_9SPHN|nr:hypothetical protein [Sphingomonas colocasiae]MBY8825526.1 hypothetical protein [Sphingomonas colocasiae]
MYREWQRAHYELRGERKLLRTCEAAATDVERGLLTPATIITLDLANGDRKSARADEIDQFAPLFGQDRDDGQADDPAVDDMVVVETGEGAETDDGSVGTQQSAQAGEYAKEPRTNESGKPPKDRSGTIRLPQRPSGTDNRGVAAPQPHPLPRWIIPLVVIVAAALLGLGYLALPGQRQSLFIVGDTATFANPAPMSGRSGTLVQGSMISVEPTDDRNWLRIVEGQYQGRFLPAVLLDKARPPALDRSAAGTVSLAAPIVLRAAPDPSSAEVARFGIESHLLLAGLVTGVDGQIWHQFTIRTADDIRRPAFALITARPPPPARSDAPPELEPVQAPEPELTTNPGQVPATTSAASGSAMTTAPPAMPRTRPVPPPPSGRESCRAARSGLERFYCQSPDLRGYEARLAASLDAARQLRVTVRPLAEYRSVASECRDIACVRTVYEEGIVTVSRARRERLADQ